jgi:hypothetical protein
VSDSHSAIAVPVDWLDALASRLKTSSVSPETGTDTLGGLEGGEMVLVISSIVQHVAANVYQGADEANATLRFFRDANHWPARAPQGLGAAISSCLWVALGNTRKALVEAPKHLPALV